MKKFRRTAVFILVLLAGITGLSIYWTFYRPLPNYETTITAGGLQNEVNIHWDTFGVPHIYASNKNDLYYSLGYVHAQDRLWQMTVSQIAAEGRFAEFLGKELLSLDQHQRTIGFWRIAREIQDSLSRETLQVLQAYADGVNDYVAEHPRELPIQFTLADMTPIPWKVTHSIAIGRLMAWELNMPWKAELSYSSLRQKLSPEKFRQLFPNERLSLSTGSHKIPPRLLADAHSFVKQAGEVQQLLGINGTTAGSNAWAVDSSKTNTSAPLLAGDPHLSLHIPGPWYEVHLNLAGKNLSGATFAGAPPVILGQNDFLAWSFTNMMLDDTDFFQEKVNPNNSNQYLLDTLAGEALYEDFTVQREVIKVKNDRDTTFKRISTHHGPVISDIRKESNEIKNRLITMKWVGQTPTNEMEALMGMGWSRSFEEFKQSIKKFKVPGQNLIYADKSGNIARFSVANVPIRTGNSIIIREGWDPAQDWQGYLSFFDLPQLVNPEKGWVANANNPAIKVNNSNYYSVYWEPESRFKRIQQYLNGSEILTSEIFQLMQNDSYSDYSKEMTQAILPILKEEDAQSYSTAISYLENWDYRYEPSETAASIMEHFLLQFSENTFMDEMGKETYNRFINYSAQPARILLRFTKNGSDFFDNIETEQEEQFRDMVLLSMEQATLQLEKDFGQEPFEWRWEKLHSLTIAPRLLGQAAHDSNTSRTLKLVVNNLLSSGPHSPPGHNYSINKGEYSWKDPFNMVVGASIRRIVDLSELSSTLSILPTGQSGNPLSEYYGDQTESWLSGQYKFLYQDSSFFRENQYRTMKLVPQK